MCVFLFRFFVVTHMHFNAFTKTQRERNLRSSFRGICLQMLLNRSKREMQSKTLRLNILNTSNRSLLLGFFWCWSVCVCVCAMYFWQKWSNRCKNGPAWESSYSGMHSVFLVHDACVEYAFLPLPIFICLLLMCRVYWHGWRTQATYSYTILMLLLLLLSSVSLYTWVWVQQTIEKERIFGKTTNVWAKGISWNKFSNMQWIHSCWKSYCTPRTLSLCRCALTSCAYCICAVRIISLHRECFGASHLQNAVRSFNEIKDGRQRKIEMFSFPFPYKCLQACNIICSSAQ